MAAPDHFLDLPFLRVADCNDWPHARPQKLWHCISVEVCRIGRGYEAEAFVSENSFTQKGRIDVAPLIEHTDQKRKRARSDFGNLVDKADSSVQHCSDEWRHHVVQFSAAFVTEANGAGEVLRRNVLMALKDVEVFARTMSQFINQAIFAYSRLTQEKRRKRLHARAGHPGGSDQLHLRLPADQRSSLRDVWAADVNLFLTDLVRDLTHRFSSHNTRNPICGERQVTT